MEKLKCPCCGYNFNKEYNYTHNIRELVNNRSKGTRNILRKIMREVSEHIITDKSRKNQFFFLKGISNVEDVVVEWGIDQYFKGAYYLKGKGYPYLRYIILNHEKNRGKMAQNEKRTLGTSPEVIIIKEGKKDDTKNSKKSS